MSAGHQRLIGKLTGGISKATDFISPIARYWPTICPKEPSRRCSSRETGGPKRTARHRDAQGHSGRYDSSDTAQRRRYGHTIAKVIERTSQDVLEVEQGSLHPTLHRLDDRRSVSSHWGASALGAQLLLDADQLRPRHEICSSYVEPHARILGHRDFRDCSVH
jgi:hypothetical protein